MSRRKSKLRKMPENGLPAVCIDGPCKGATTRVKDPRKPVIIPMHNNVAYFCAIYRATLECNQFNEVKCTFVRLQMRPK